MGFVARQVIHARHPEQLPGVISGELLGLLQSGQSRFLRRLAADGIDAGRFFLLAESERDAKDETAGSQCDGETSFHVESSRVVEPRRPWVAARGYPNIPHQLP